MCYLSACFNAVSSLRNFKTAAARVWKSIPSYAKEKSVQEGREGESHLSACFNAVASLRSSLTTAASASGFTPLSSKDRDNRQVFTDMHSFVLTLICCGSALAEPLSGKRTSTLKNSASAGNMLFFSLQECAEKMQSTFSFVLLR